MQLQFGGKLRENRGRQHITLRGPVCTTDVYIAAAADAEGLGRAGGKVRLRVEAQLCQISTEICVLQEKDIRADVC